MSKVNNKSPIERAIHQKFHDLSDEYGLDIDRLSNAIADFVEWEKEMMPDMPTPSEN